MGKFISSFAGFAAGIFLGVVLSFALNSWQNFQERQNLISAFVGDIETLMAQEKKDRESWYNKMKLLVEVDSLKKAKGRPWLMREAFDSARMVVFEANAGKLGTLPKPLPKEIASFYALTARMKAEIQHLANPQTIKANKNENEVAIGEHKVTRQQWMKSSGAIRELLRGTADEYWLTFWR